MAPRVTQVRASPGKATEGPDGGTWEAGERVRRQVGTTLSSIVWSIREQAHGSGNRAESALRAVGGHRRSPSWLGLSANSGFLGVGRAGGLRRGRCKYVHVSSVAASMRLTPLRSPPARPRTGSCAASHERQKKKTKAKAGRCALQCLISDISWVPASGRHYREAFTHGRRSRKSVGGGGVGASRTVGAMDGAIEPPWMGLRRVLLARQPTGSQLLLLLLPLPWPRRVPGAARPEPFPRFRYNVGPVSQLRFPGHDGPRGRARPVAVPPRTS